MMLGKGGMHGDRLKAVLLHATVKGCTAESEGFCRVAYVAAESRQRLADEQRLDFFKAHAFERGCTGDGTAERKIAAADGIARAEQHCAFDGMIKLSHIARPKVLEHGLHCPGFEALCRLAIALRIGFEKVLREQGNVFAAVA